MEHLLHQEMEKYGALENPFTVEYLDYLLRKQGFVNIVQYFSVNGLFPVDTGNRTVQSVSQDSLSAFVAFKQFLSPTTRVTSARTSPQIEVLTARIEKSFLFLSAKLKLVNI